VADLVRGSSLTLPLQDPHRDRSVSLQLRCSQEVTDCSEPEPPIAQADLPVGNPGTPAHREVHPTRSVQSATPADSSRHSDLDTKLRDGRSQLNQLRSCLRSNLLDSVNMMTEEGIALVVFE
jgi:hypothetical protein